MVGPARTALGRVALPEAPFPPASELARIESAAFELARAAGERALRAYRSAIQLDFKGDKQDDPVTATDRAIETFLRAELRQTFPDHGLLGEEHADDIAADAAYVWALDPLDGTANFASHLPLWGVSLGLLHHGRPVVGCIWVPVGPDLACGVYHARLGGGAWWNRDRRLSIASADEDLRGRLIALPGRYWTTFRFRRPPRGTPRARRMADPRALGSITAELVAVAAGSLRLAVFVQPRIWDVAAGALVVQEAGGVALTWRDRGWQPLEVYDPQAPAKGTDPAALRHWTRPVVVGEASVVTRATSHLVWHPRLPKPLQRLLGIKQPGG